jgi:hypothetical protein
VADASEPNDKIQLSLSQIAASCLAAVSAAVLCSFFGVAGTVIGTAIASLFATIGSALYAHSLRRTKARLRRLHQAGAAAPPLTEVFKTTRQQGREWLDQIQWRLVAIGAAAVFVVSIGLVTIIEISAGQSFAGLFGVSHAGSRDSTLGSLVGLGPHSSHHHSPKPAHSPTASPTSSVTKTATASPAPTHTVTVTPTPTVTVTATTPPASPSPTASSPAP